MNSCLLSLLSPVLRTMVCGSFRESVCKKKGISLCDVEAANFSKLLRFACGEEGLVAEDVEELLDLGRLAERLEMKAVRAHIEKMVLAELRVENCVKIYQRNKAAGLDCLQKQCYKMLRDQFKIVCQMEDFLKLDEETIGDLLEEDELGVDREEDVFEALVRWIVSSGDRSRGKDLLKKIRFGLVNDEFLAEEMSSALPCVDGFLKELVEEARMKKGEPEGDVKGSWDGVERLCGKWMVPRKMKGRILGEDVLRNPLYVAIDQRQRIVVTDDELCEVIVLNSDDSIARRLGTEGEDPGQFNGLMGVAVDRQGHIIVADCDNHRIQILNGNDSVARCLGSKGTAVGQLNEPYGVAIDSEGYIVVADNENHRIQVFNADGFVVRHFGSKGAAVGQLNLPMGVAVDGAGRFVVADSYNHRVQVFNGDGSVALCFGSEGDGPGQFNRPSGVAVDNEGHFVVADTQNDRLQVFNSDGSVARVICGAEDGGDQLSNPVGVAVDGAGRIVVAETIGGRGKYCRIRVL